MTHVLAVRLDNDGDVLLAGPAIRALAARAERVTLLCGPRGGQAARLLPGVDDVFVRCAEWIDPEPPVLRREAIDAYVDAIAALRADAAVVFTSFHQSPLPAALLLRMAGVPRVSAISEDYPGSLLDVRHRVADDIHEVERGLSLAAAAGYPLPPEDDARLAIREPAGGVVRRSGYVVVHPGASVPARAWEPEHHAELVAALAAAGRRVVVTGAPSETALTAAVAGHDGTDLGGRTTFAELAAVLAGAEVVVVGNTGPAHLAAAVGTPVVSLFAPTVPAVRWRPWGVPHELLAVDVPCAGCRARSCPVPGHPCLSGVTPGEVMAAVQRLAPVREEALA
jgi:ADP-heptose:LPS heptosyltransferase